MLISQNESEKECPECGLKWYSGGTKSCVTIMESCPRCKKLLRIQLIMYFIIISLKMEEENEKE
jgi:hypothetical protein